MLSIFFYRQRRRQCYIFFTLQLPYTQLNWKYIKKNETDTFHYLYI